MRKLGFHEQCKHKHKSAYLTVKTGLMQTIKHKRKNKHKDLNFFFPCACACA